MISYAQEFYEGYIKPNGLITFTHKDVQRETDTNCTYSVVQDLRALFDLKGFNVKEVWEERTNKRNQTKRYKRYFIEKKD